MVTTPLGTNDIHASNGALASSAYGSAVSWGAIIAGAVAAAAISFLLIILGAGLGLSSVSAWSGQGASAEAIGWSTIIWLTLTQIIAAGLGGYLAGRLRSRWVSVHGDEVYFRDTAHGFLAWALSILITAAVLVSAIGSVVTGAGKATASVVGGAAGQATTLIAGSTGNSSNELGSTFTDYYVGSLLRRTDIDVPPSGFTSGSMAASAEEAARLTQEVTPIFINSVQNGSVSQQDKTYVAQLISRYTGVSANEAEQRIDETFHTVQTRLQEAETAAREAAEAARKAAAYTTLWIFISLLIGAFSASLLATFGGRQRDN